MSSHAANGSSSSRSSSLSVYELLLRLYQSRFGPEEKEECLNALPNNIRKKLFHNICVLAEHRPEALYGQMHIFDSPSQLQEAVQKVAEELFKSLPQTRQDQIEKTIKREYGSLVLYHLSRAYHGAPAGNLPLMLRSMHSWAGGLTPKLQDILDAWVDEGEATEQRAEARKEILLFLTESQKNHLYLESLNLKNLPDIFNKYPFVSRLTHLNLSRNQLAVLPKTMGHLQNLEMLNLSWNLDLEELPNELIKLPGDCGVSLTNTKLLERIHSYDPKKALLFSPSKARFETNSNATIEFLRCYCPSAVFSGDLTSELRDRLTAWVCEGEAGEARAEAADRIMNFLKNPGESTLKLGGLDLKSLPLIFDAPPFAARLTTLILSSNQLEELPEQIAQLHNLISLVLDDNQLTTLPEQIAQLPHLATLVLSNNRLKTLPRPICQLYSLRGLYLDRNQLSWLPERIGDLRNLTELGLDHNQLFWLPEQIGNLRNLTGLGLGHNQLSELPERIGDLQNLTKLLLDHNQFSVLPSQISHLRNLISLGLNENQLATLPAQIGKLCKLSSLNLASNTNLQGLPNSVLTLPQDCTVDITNTPLLGFIDDQAQRAAYLHHLKIPRIKIATLRLPSYALLFQEEQETIQRLTSWANEGDPREPRREARARMIDFLKDPKRETLNLERLSLTSLPPIFHHPAFISRLNELDLSENKLKTLPEELYLLKNLRMLNLGQNRLKALPEQMGKLQALERLYLNGNDLSELPKAIGKLKNLKVLNLSSNSSLQELPNELLKLSRFCEVNIEGTHLLRRINSYLDKTGNRSFVPFQSLDSLSICPILTLNTLLCRFSSVAFPRNLTPELAQALDLWVSQGDPEEKKDVAKNRIVTFFKHVENSLLALNHLGLKSAPPIFDDPSLISQLESLHLGSNNLAAIPEQIGNLQNLKTLYLNDNQITALPKQIGQLKTLKQLYLENNQLIGLPEQIGQLKTLKQLYLDNNQLMGLPEEVGDLRNLQILGLSENPNLQGLPLGLLNLSHDCSVFIRHTWLSKHILDYAQKTSLFLTRQGFALFLDNGGSCHFPLSSFKEFINKRALPALLKLRICSWDNLPPLPF